MRKIPLLILIFIAFSAYAQEDDEWFQGRPIRNIVFEGLNNVRASDLEGLTERFIGQNFTDQLYWEILGGLYALEYFESIVPRADPADPLRSEVILRFRVTERPTVSRINFIGNSSIRRNELLDTISSRVNSVAT